MASCRTIGGKRYDLVPSKSGTPCKRGGVTRKAAAVKPRAAAKSPSYRATMGAEQRAATKEKKPRKLPPPITGTLTVGEQVSVLQPGESVVSHAIVERLPDALGKPAVKFHNGPFGGVSRFVRMDQLRKGWLQPRDGWQPWRP